MWGLLTLAITLIASSILALAFGFSKIYLIHGAMDKFVLILWTCIFGTILIFGILMLRRMFVRRR